VITMRLNRSAVGVVALALAASALRAGAEPIFLSRQYTRCTTCHYSPTGGGLLTPYGRSLSGHEVSTTSGHEQSPQQQGPGKEESFLWGALGHTLGTVNLGLDFRPAYLGFDVGGQTASTTMLMTADLLAAWRAAGWTVYGEIGRQPLTPSKIDSYEYWVGHETDSGYGFRVGRFLPAYGVRLADHTALTRLGLGFDAYDQVYGLELSRSTEHRLLQLSLGPGRADSVLHDDGRRAFTATGRFQMDLGPRTALVLSGLFRDTARSAPQNGAAGVAFGIAPTRHVSVWSEADAQFQKGVGGTPGFVLLNETGFEVYRGVWLKVSPQLRTLPGDSSSGVFRMLFEANLLPRTHWNVDVSYYRDKGRASSLVTKTFLAQLHLYL
jgi:hypothetical protein